jgi:filamentous hemagglutinin family protein
MLVMDLLWDIQFSALVSALVRAVVLLTLGVIVGTPAKCLAQSIRFDGKLSPIRQLAGPDYIIKQSDGRAAGQNLFHSFQKFNLDLGEKAIFESDAGIRNILSRVTGGSRSEINGLIKTNPGVNLFLINPNGILFGESASLDIGGSFVATTANAIKFGNRGFFDASIPTDLALLTIDPSALIFKQSGAKSIINRSHSDLGTRPNPATIPPFKPLFGLKVEDGKSLLLVGGDLSLENGGLNALGGRIELAAIAGLGEVGLNINDTQLSLNVPKNLTLAKISLLNGSAIDTSGEGAGNIRLYGKNILIKDGSQVLSQVLGSKSGGNIFVRASNSIELIGTRMDGERSTSSQFSTQAQSSGAGGNIKVETKDLSVLDGANIGTSSTASGMAGNVILNASDTITVRGSLTHGPSFVISSNVASGDGGDITISAQKLLMQEFGIVQTASTGVLVDKKFVPATGASGNININVDILSLDGSGLLASSSLGQASNIIIRVKDISLNQSTISASADIGNLQSGGNVSITANKLDLQESQIIARADQGPGGIILIQTQTLNKDSSSDIDADSARSTDGRVILNTLEFSPKNLATILVDQTNQISEECVPIARPGVSSFAVIGRGGVPASPEEPLSPENVWVDWATLPPAKVTHPIQPNAKSSPSKTQDSPATLPQPPAEIVEAQSWVRNAKGEIYLVAAASGHNTGPMAPACK